MFLHEPPYVGTYMPYVEPRHHYNSPLSLNSVNMSLNPPGVPNVVVSNKKLPTKPEVMHRLIQL